MRSPLCVLRCCCAALGLQASSSGGSGGSAPGLLQRLGRVLKEKAAGDIDRFIKGTSKTRERLGVSRSLHVTAGLCVCLTSGERREEGPHGVDSAGSASVTVHRLYLLY